MFDFFLSQVFHKLISGFYKTRQHNHNPACHPYVLAIHAATIFPSPTTSFTHHNLHSPQFSPHPPQPPPTTIFSSSTTTVSHIRGVWGTTPSRFHKSPVAIVRCRSHSGRLTLPCAVPRNDASHHPLGPFTTSPMKNIKMRPIGIYKEKSILNCTIWCE